MAQQPDGQQRALSLRSSPTHSPEVPSGSSWFLGIGINAYKHFQALNNAVRDIEDFRNLIVRRYDIESNRAHLLLNEEATRDGIIGQLSRLATEVGRQDKLIIYYSGHGYYEKEPGIGYWIPYDAKENDIVEYLLNSALLDYIRRIRARHILLISDACFSGSLFQRGTMRFSGPVHTWEHLASRWAICSGRYNELVYDGDPGGHSPFAESMLQILEKNQIRELNVARFADEVIRLTRSKYQGQLPEGNPLLDNAHHGGQYIFRLQTTEKQEWEKTLATNTIVSYNEYLEHYPEGQYVSQALEAIRILEEENVWEDAEKLDKISGFRSYLSQYPRGRHASIAKESIQRLLAELFEEELPIIDTFEISGSSVPSNPVADMIRISGGEFWRGSRGRKALEDEKPRHKVLLPDFYVDPYPVTFRQFRAFVEATGHKTDAEKAGGAMLKGQWVAGLHWQHDTQGRKRGEEQGDHPVLFVSWNDAMAYAAYEGKRLPTEAEWEYVAQGGKGQNAFSFAGSNAVEEVAWYAGNSSGKTRAVGLKLPNELGVYDMSGLVWEWCADHYSALYYQQKVYFNPQGPSSGPGRVFRGGSWANPESHLQLKHRNFAPDTYAGNSIGFRCAKNIDP